MPDIDLAELERLFAAATKGPWMVVDGDIWDGGTVDSDSPGIPLFREDMGAYRRWGRTITRAELEADAALIVAMHTALPRLLEAAREGERLREALGNIVSEEPMNQDERGGCVWCGGPFGKRSGQYASADPRDHDKDCAWLKARAALASPKPAQEAKDVG